MKDRSGPFSNLHVLIITIIENSKIKTSIIRIGTFWKVNIILVSDEKLGMYKVQESGSNIDIISRRRIDRAGILTRFKLY